MIGIGFGVRISQGASSARQSRPASNNSTRLAGSSESRAATAAPAEPPPTTMTSYMALLLDVPENRNRRRYQTAQNYALYPHKTVRNNLAFSLRMASLP